VLLADDHPVVRHGLRELLSSEPDFRVVADVEDGAEAVQRALADDVDLAILDVTMPRMTGLQAARELTARKPELRILMLSMHENEQFLFEALRVGASGYVLRPPPTETSSTRAARRCAARPSCTPERSRLWCASTSTVPGKATPDRWIRSRRESSRWSSW
jgi:DNA-binding NarL/FixJ family response regulator